ncbi:MAG: putative signal transduction protein with EAL and GGDEF domain [Bermanella sp.]|jgi:predicted signal transduction protein with EAL and GGDEF domain
MAAAIILIVDVYCVIHLLSLLAAPHGIGSYYYFTMLGAFFLGIKGGVIYTIACFFGVFALYTGEAMHDAEAMTEFLVLLISIVCTAVIAFYYEQAVLKRTYFLAEASESVTLLAQVDYLTDIYNRRQFTVNAINRLEQIDPATLVALKVDDFESIKDTHGYATGDQILRDVSKVLASQFKD